MTFKLRASATIAEVAAEAGVSISTVSRYLRGQPVRHPERIASAVQRLRYRPNAAAQSLRLKTMAAIAVVVTDITNPYSALLVRGLQSVAVSPRSSLYLAGGTSDLAAVVQSIGGRVDGIICAAATDRHVVEALEHVGKPAVLVEFEPSDYAHSFDVIVVDNVTGSRNAVGKLIELGHRRIGVIAGSDENSVGRERRRGAEQAIAEAGGAVAGVVEVADFSVEGGYEATARLMVNGEVPTAIFAPNNLTSLGALKCLHDLGVRIPDQMSFIGFDPQPTGDLMVPSPSTVDRPEAEQGALAMRLLDSRMRGQGPADPRRMVLETKLVIRGSCGPPPA